MRFFLSTHGAFLAAKRIFSAYFQFSYNQTVLKILVSFNFYPERRKNLFTPEIILNHILFP
jgi:hypothetical protein